MEKKEQLIEAIKNGKKYFLILVWNYKGGEANNISIYSAEELINTKNQKEITSYFYTFPD